MTICAKTSILDVWQDSEYASELASKFKDLKIVWIPKVTGSNSTTKNQKERAKKIIK